MREGCSGGEAEVVARVTAWFADAARTLPWRSSGVTPWGVLVSEVIDVHLHEEVDLRDYQQNGPHPHGITSSQRECDSTNRQCGQCYRQMQSDVVVGVRPYGGQEDHQQVQQNDPESDERIGDCGRTVVPLLDGAPHASGAGRWVETWVDVSGQVSGGMAWLKVGQLAGHRSQCVIPRGCDRRRLEWLR